MTQNCYWDPIGCYFLLHDFNNQNPLMEVFLKLANSNYLLLLRFKKRFHPDRILTADPVQPVAVGGNKGDVDLVGSLIFKISHELYQS